MSTKNEMFIYQPIAKSILFTFFVFAIKITYKIDYPSINRKKAYN